MVMMPDRGLFLTGRCYEAAHCVPDGLPRGGSWCGPPPAAARPEAYRGEVGDREFVQSERDFPTPRSFAYSDRSLKLACIPRLPFAFRGTVLACGRIDPAPQRRRYYLTASALDPLGNVL